MLVHPPEFPDRFRGQQYKGDEDGKTDDYD